MAELAHVLVGHAHVDQPAACHANIGQGPRDVATYKESFHNPYFDHMMAEGIEFLQQAGGPL